MRCGREQLKCASARVTVQSCWQMLTTRIAKVNRAAMPQQCLAHSSHKGLTQCGGVRGRGTDVANLAVRATIDTHAARDVSGAGVFVDIVSAFYAVVRGLMTPWYESDDAVAKLFFELGLGEELRAGDGALLEDVLALVTLARDAAGLVRDAAGLVRDATGPARDATGPARDATGRARPRDPDEESDPEEPDREDSDREE